MSSAQNLKKAIKQKNYGYNRKKIFKNFMRIFSFFLIFFVPFSFLIAKEHEFFGNHLIASYYECDLEAIKDVKKLEYIMKKAVDASGAAFLTSCQHYFTENGFSMVILLSESHASIHTYPEYGACFVDIFTCGKYCKVERFHQVLIEYLSPQKIQKKILERN